MSRDYSGQSEAHNEAAVAELSGEHANSPLRVTRRVKPLGRVWHIMNAARFFSPETLALEPELVAKKWHEYRNLSPHQANIAFAREYCAAAQHFYKKSVDVNTVGKVKGLDITSITSPKETHGQSGKGKSQLTAINKARQFADEHGLRYGEFIYFCMDFALRRPISKFLPRPNQLIPSGGQRREVFNELFARHIEELKEPGCGSLASTVQMDPNKQPGCYGVPGSYSPVTEVCAHCAFNPRCSRVVTEVQSELIKIESASGVVQFYADKMKVKKEADRVRRAVAEKHRRAKKKATKPTTAM